MTNQIFKSPGITLSSLFDYAPISDIVELVGLKTQKLLVSLDPSFSQEQKFRKVAKLLIDPQEALSDYKTRIKLIELLPIEKAQELASRLNITIGQNVYSELKQISEKPEALETIKSFFGIVAEDRAPETLKSTIEEVRPEYGLFPHQLDAAKRVFSQLVNPPRKVLLHMPTGAGKTRTAMHVVANHLRLYGPTIVIWLAYSSELLEQAADTFQEAWKNLGDRSIQLIRFWGDRNSDLREIKDGFIIAGLGKMYSAYNKDRKILQYLGDRTTLTVIDEAHQAIAPTHRWVAEGLYTKQPQNALLGLTATPGRTWADIEKDKELSEFFERCKVTLQVEGYDDPVSFLIDEGYLAKPTFRNLVSDAQLELSEAEIDAIGNETDLSESILDKLGDVENRNVAIVAELEDMMKRHSRILFFASSVKQARLIAAVLAAREFEADVVTGETPTVKRRRLIRRFRSKDPIPYVLANFGVLTTGFDAPNASAALIARPTKSLVLYSQMVGRATRGPKVGGNERAEIVTIIDTNLPGFGNIIEAFHNWEDIWYEH